MLKKLMVGAVAGVSLLAASDVRAAEPLAGWVVAGLNTATDATVESDFCTPAIDELSDQNFRFRGSNSIDLRLTAHLFMRSDGAATLFCFFNIFEEQSGPGNQ